MRWLKRDHPVSVLAARLVPRCDAKVLFPDFVRETVWQEHGHDVEAVGATYTLGREFITSLVKKK